MKILSIETATEACSAALDISDHCIQRFEICPRKHTELILPMINELLQEADISTNQLDAIAFGQGPGAFTGVRIAIGVVQGIAFAHDIPVIPISTLAALAQRFSTEHNQVATAIDARMSEVYWGLYRKDECGLMRIIGKETVCAPEEVPVLNEGHWYGAGTGWETYAETLQRSFNGNLSGFKGNTYPSAKDILALAKPAYLSGRTLPVELAMPVYLRNQVVQQRVKA